MKFDEFENAEALRKWFAGRGGTTEPLVNEMIDLLEKFGAWEPKSPIMKAIEREREDQAFFAALDDAIRRPVVVQTQTAEEFQNKPFAQILRDKADHFGMQPDLCGKEIPGTHLNCNLNNGHASKCVWNNKKEKSLWPLLHEADPELERLLAEEEEIERRHNQANALALKPQGLPGGTILPDMPVRVLANIDEEEDGEETWWYDDDDDYDDSNTVTIQEFDD